MKIPTVHNYKEARRQQRAHETVENHVPNTLETKPRGRCSGRQHCLRLRLRLRLHLRLRLCVHRTASLLASTTLDHTNGQ